MKLMTATHRLQETKCIFRTGHVDVQGDIQEHIVDTVGGLRNGHT